MNLDTAEQVDIWVQVSSFILHGLISSFDFYVWMLHLKADQLMCKPSYTLVDIKLLERFIFLYKEGMKLCFVSKSDNQENSSDSLSDENEERSETDSGDDDESDGDDDDEEFSDEDENGGDEFDEDDYEDGDDECVNDDVENYLYYTKGVPFEKDLANLNDRWKEDAPGRIQPLKKPLLELLSSTKGFHFCYPKFEAESFWPRYLLFLDPARFTNTKLLENKNLKVMDTDKARIYRKRYNSYRWDPPKSEN